MNLSDFFPMWKQLTYSEQQALEQSTTLRRVKKGTMVHQGGSECTGLLLVKSGQLRTYILSEDGREITIYRLFEMDMCLLSATCMMQSLQFDITIETEKDAEVYVVAPDIYKQLMEESVLLANYTNEIMATRFSEVMWLMEQIMWKRFDQRLAHFLVEEASIEESNVLHMTHEMIGNHMGNPREVVTRMLKYFQSEGMIHLSRGTIEILDMKKLETIQNS